MSFAPTPPELLARARADLRMGVPVVLTGADGSGALALAAETLTPARLADLRAMGGAPVLAITARRATTLKARPYDDDLARLHLPPDAGLPWILAVADPADDLEMPMKGPFLAYREGSADLHRLAISLAKSARLLPAALLLDLPDPAGFAASNALTHLPAALVAPLMTASPHPDPVVSARHSLFSSGSWLCRSATAHFYLEILSRSERLVVARRRTQQFSTDFSSSP